MVSRFLSRGDIGRLIGLVRPKVIQSVQRAPLSMFKPSASMTEGLMDSIVRSDSAWVDAPTTIIEDPLHPNGFDFRVDLNQLPSSTSGVALFAKEHVQKGLTHDPFDLVAGEITSLSEGIRNLLGSDHPVLELCARYFFESGRDGGKKVRPTMVLLLSIASNQHALTITGKGASVGAMASTIPSESASRPSQVLSSQRRLAEITEMIHTASLFHDDVIDKSDTRRGAPSANRAYGDKLAILAGDFLLARASVALARLRNLEVVELLSTVIEHLVKGEVMQMRGGHLKNCTAMEYYLHKNYYKTGSLMANSCRAAVVLGGHDEAVQNIAFAYGKHLGLAFQVPGFFSHTHTCLPFLNHCNDCIVGFHFVIFYMCLMLLFLVGG
jgi:geranylgeranyl pyrophosphate synthase